MFIIWGLQSIPKQMRSLIGLILKNGWDLVFTLPLTPTIPQFEILFVESPKVTPRWNGFSMPR